MTIRAVTFDFWSTLFRNANSEGRWRVRAGAIQRATGAPEEAIRAALREVGRRFEAYHLAEHRTLGPADALPILRESLHATFSEDDERGIVQALGEAIVQHGPEPEPGALEAVAAAAARVPVALISDTGISPGASLRRLMAKHGFDTYLKVQIYSDETGVSKPQPQAFEKASAALGVAPEEILHIGDLEPTDVAGIHGVGGTAALFTGINDRFQADTRAEHVFADWPAFTRALPALLDR